MIGTLMPPHSSCCEVIDEYALKLTLTVLPETVAPMEFMVGGLNHWLLALTVEAVKLKKPMATVQRALTILS